MDLLIVFSAHIDAEHVLFIVCIMAASLPDVRSEHHGTRHLSVLLEVSATHVFH